jgi:hypothetical protein
MRRFCYRSFVWLLAAAFAASGATWRQGTAAHFAPAVAVSADASAHHERHGHAGGHGAHHGDHATAGHGDNTAAASESLPSADHACQKCCSMCNVASVVPDDISADVTPVVSSIVFLIATNNLTERIPLLDPGIPKRLT